MGELAPKSKLRLLPALPRRSLCQRLSLHESSRSLQRSIAAGLLLLKLCWLYAFLLANSLLDFLSFLDNILSEPHTTSSCFGTSKLNTPGLFIHRTWIFSSSTCFNETMPASTTTGSGLGVCDQCQVNDAVEYARSRPMCR